MGKKSLLILLRHGQSIWNKRNLFTGWVDVPLSPEGIEEALKAGSCLSHIPFDALFTSTLMRAQATLALVMSCHRGGKTPVFQHMEAESHLGWYQQCAPSSHLLPVWCAWELNERMYGALQGLDKDETRAKYGAEQVKVWRRSFDVPPPQGESLAMTAARTLPYFHRKIVPELALGKNVLVSAHGNSLRSIIMELDSLSKEEVVELEIPTGEPLCYSYERGHFEKSPLP